MWKPTRTNAIHGQKAGSFSISYDEDSNKRKIRPPIGGDMTDNVPLIALLAAVQSTIAPMLKVLAKQDHPEARGRRSDEGVSHWRGYRRVGDGAEPACRRHRMRGVRAV